MQEHTQSVFLIEKIQPTWLTPPQWKQYYSRFLMLIILFTGGGLWAGSVLLATALGLNVWLFGLLNALALPVNGWIIARARQRYPMGRL
jgi:hypothetical protein